MTRANKTSPEATIEYLGIAIFPSESSLPLSPLVNHVLQAPRIRKSKIVQYKENENNQIKFECFQNTHVITCVPTVAEVLVYTTTKPAPDMSEADPVLAPKEIGKSTYVQIESVKAHSSLCARCYKDGLGTLVHGKGWYGIRLEQVHAN